MVYQAAEEINKVKKTASTHFRANITMAVDESVIEQVGKILRCRWIRERGRGKQVVNG